MAWANSTEQAAMPRRPVRLGMSSRRSITLKLAGKCPPQLAVFGQFFELRERPQSCSRATRGGRSHNGEIETSQAPINHCDMAPPRC